MVFALPYTSGHTYDNINGKCTVPIHTPESIKRRWLHKGTNYACASGCSCGGGESSSTLFISPINGISWTGVSGVVLMVYCTNTSHDDRSISYGDLKQQQSRLATNCWDINLHNWYSLGEFLFSRSASGATGTYPNTYNSKKFDVGSSWTAKPLIEDHCYIQLSLDNKNYIWGAYGGHAGISTGYGYCPIQCFKSTKPITDASWSPSGSDMWINLGAITISTSAAYIKIHTGLCSCHNNWYFAGFRNGSTTSEWRIFYSYNSGHTWKPGIPIAKAFTSTYSYSSFNFQHDPVSDKTLVFVRPYPDFGAPINYNNPGHAIYWTDCHRISGSEYLPDKKGGFFATSVDPQNIDNNTIPTYSGSKIPPFPDETSSGENTYYFNSYEEARAWENEPANMSDGDDSIYAATTYNNINHLLNGNTSDGSGTITKVEIRAKASMEGEPSNINLIPVFSAGNGDTQSEQVEGEEGYTSWFDITDITNSPDPWSWTDVANLDCEVFATGLEEEAWSLRCSIVQIRVTTSTGGATIKSFDRYDITMYPGLVHLEPSTRKIFFLSDYVNNNYSITDNLRLSWKTLGTSDYFVSTSVWQQTGTEKVIFHLADINIVSGSNDDKYWLVPIGIDNTDDRDNYAYFLVGDGTNSPIWSSQSNWKLMKSCTTASGSVRTRKWANVSKDKKFVSIAYGYSTNRYGNIPVGTTFKESFLTFWNNTTLDIEEEEEALFSTYPSLRTYAYGYKKYLENLMYGSNGRSYIPLGEGI